MLTPAVVSGEAGGGSPAAPRPLFLRPSTSYLHPALNTKNRVLGKINLIDDSCRVHLSGGRVGVLSLVEEQGVSGPGAWTEPCCSDSQGLTLFSKHLSPAAGVGVGRAPQTFRRGAPCASPALGTEDSAAKHMGVPALCL